MGNRLNGKVAVITGGTSGIGEATVELFVEEGAKVVFTGRNENAGRAIADRVGAAACFVQGDMRLEADIKRAIDTAVDRFGRLDCLFNNAGAGTRGTLETVTRLVRSCGRRCAAPRQGRCFPPSFRCTT